MSRYALICSLTVLLMSAGFTGDGFAQVLSLEDAMGIAMSNSPDIKRSQLSLERSQESLNAQKAALKSRFSLSITPYDYTQARSFNELFTTWYTSETTSSSSRFTIAQPIKWTDGTLALINQFGWQESYSEYSDRTQRAFSNNLYLSLQQPLFTYNRTQLELRELELDLENTALSYAMQMLNLERSVTQSFFNVYADKMSLEIAEASYANQQESFAIIKNKVDAGLSAEEELYQAELNLLNSESSLKNSQVALANSLDAFKQLIGISLFDEIDVAEDISHQSVEVDLQMALDHGLQYRMELRQREISIENAQFSLVRTKAMNEFRGDINISYGIIGEDEDVHNVYETPTQNQRFSFALDIPLWDWGEKKSRIKATEATIKSQELNLEDMKNDIIIGIRQIYRSLQNLENQIIIAEKNVENAELTYDINLERYRNGDLTSMDLRLFENQLSQSRMSHVNSLINYKIGLLNLKIQSLYDFVKNESVVPEELIQLN